MGPAGPPEAFRGSRVPQGASRKGGGGRPRLRRVYGGVEGVFQGSERPEAGCPGLLYGL